MKAESVPAPSAASARGKSKRRKSARIGRDKKGCHVYHPLRARARVVREVGDLVRRANEAGKRLATLAVDTEVRFRSATDRAAFSKELTEAITTLVSKYHDESAPGGRVHRLVVVAHPLPQEPEPKEPS